MTYISEKSISQFDEKRVAERTPIISLNGAIPLSGYRDRQDSSGTGVVTENDSEYRVRHTSSGDFVKLLSARKGIYVPGASAESGIGVRLTTDTLSGDGVGYWGYFEMGENADGSDTQDIQNGFLFGLDSSGFFVEVIKAGNQQHKTYEANYNITPSPNINYIDGNIFQVDFTYYGYGLIIFQKVVGETADNRQIVQNLHSVRLTGGTSATNPNLQVGALDKSSSTTGDFSIYVSGRQFSTVGKQAGRGRITPERLESVTISTSFVPIMTFKRKQGYKEIAIDPYGFDILSSGNAVVQIRLNSDITGGTAPNFLDISETTTDEHSLSVDTSATSININSGIKVYEQLVSGGSKNKSEDLTDNSGIPLDLPDGAELTFAAKSLTGSQITGATFIGMMREHW